MNLGIFAKTFPGTNPLNVLHAARQAGYEAVQYNMACSGLSSLPARVTEAETHDVTAAAKSAGVEIAALSATYNMIDPDPLRRQAGRTSFAALAKAAGGMGTRLLTVCSGSRDPHDQWRHHPDNVTADAWRDMCAEFEILLEIAETHDVTIGVEPELGNVVSSAAKARQLLDLFNNPRIKIVLDPVNLFEVEAPERQRTIVAKAIGLLADSIILAHAKDRHSDGQFATAGAGVLDWQHYISALRSNGFDGALVTHGLSAAEAPSVSAFLSRLLEAHAR